MLISVSIMSCIISEDVSLGNNFTFIFNIYVSDFFLFCFYFISQRFENVLLEPPEDWAGIGLLVH